MPKAKKDLVKLGSNTAKDGFRNEDDVVIKFNNWSKDNDAQAWLIKMGYSLKEIDRVLAVKLHGYKTDVQVQITIYLKNAISAENLSLKLVSNPRGYNQVDKRWVDKYVEMWGIPENIVSILKRFTGEITPNKKGLRDGRRMFLDEFGSNEQKEIVDFFKENKLLVVTDILKGRGKFSASWMLVVLKKPINSKRWILKDINEAMNIFASGDICITKRGSLKIDKITMQRKGGDGGRATSNMLQFKVNPMDLFGE